MPYVYVPENTPPMFGGGYPPYQPVAPSEEVKIAKAIIKRDKADKKKKQSDDKKKEDAKKPRLFTSMEMGGMIFLFSIPVVLSQLWLLAFVQKSLNTLLAVHPVINP